MKIFDSAEMCFHHAGTHRDIHKPEGDKKRLPVFFQLTIGALDQGGSAVSPLKGCKRIDENVPLRRVFG